MGASLTDIAHSLKSQWIQKGYAFQHIVHGEVFNVNAVLADCLFADEHRKKTSQNKLATAMTDFREQIDIITTPSGGGNPRRAKLNSIILQICPLLIPQFHRLQYYVDIWKTVYHDWQVLYLNPNIDVPNSEVNNTSQHITVLTEIHYPNVEKQHQKHVSPLHLLLLLLDGVIISSYKSGRKIYSSTLCVRIVLHLMQKS